MAKNAHMFPHPRDLKEARDALNAGVVSTDEIRALMLTAVQVYRMLRADRVHRRTPDDLAERVWLLYRGSFMGFSKHLPEEVDLDDPGFQVVAQFVKDALDRLDAYNPDAGVYILPDKSVV